MALEAELLASLQHPNIIKLRGITFAGALGFADGPQGYFLVIDRLEETLEERMRRWRNPETRKKPRALFRRSSADNTDWAGDYKAESMDERLTIGMYGYMICMVSCQLEFNDFNVSTYMFFLSLLW